MSISVKLYKNFKKRDNSTLLPLSGSPADNYSCVLKDNCSITDPYLEVAISSGNPAALGYNYAYIEDFSRYYFIEGWEYSRGLWTCTLSEDVLASFKTQIGALTKYVNRSSAEKNGYLTDTIYPTAANANVTYLTNDSPFRVNPNGSFIVGIIGKSQTNVPNIGGVNYYLMDLTEMQKFLDYLMSGTFASLLADSTAGLTEAVVKTIADPMDYIETCVWFPFAISTGLTTKVQPQIGWWSNISPIPADDPDHPGTAGCTVLGSGLIDALKFSPLGSWDNSFTLTDHPQILRGAYVNAEPYSHYIFHLEPWGDIPLDGKLLMNNRTLTYSIQCEGISGMAALEIYAGGHLITRQLAQVGVPMSVAQILNNVDKLESVGTVAAGAASAVTSVKGNEKLKNALKGFLKGETAYRGLRGVKAIVSSLKDVGTDVLSGVEAYTGEASLVGSNGSIISYTGTYIASTQMHTEGPYIKITRFNMTADNNYELGSPLCDNKRLDTISGYIQCADGEHDIAALDDEKSTISAYLTGGFFYE